MSAYCRMPKLCGWNENMPPQSAMPPPLPVETTSTLRTFEQLDGAPDLISAQTIGIGDECLRRPTNNVRAVSGTTQTQRSVRTNNVLVENAHQPGASGSYALPAKLVQPIQSYLLLTYCRGSTRTCYHTICMYVLRSCLTAVACTRGFSYASSALVQRLRVLGRVHASGPTSLLSIRHRLLHGDLSASTRLATPLSFPSTIPVELA